MKKSHKRHSKVLLTLTTIYAILYAAIIIGFFITETLPEQITFEGIMVSLGIIIFFLGYYYSWKNELIAGIIFIFWWGIMWYIGLFVAETDRGAGVVMGFPMFFVGLFFIISYYRH